MSVSLGRKRAILALPLLAALWLLGAFDAQARADKPKITAKHAITGSAIVGGTLTAEGGLWTGTPPFTLSYQWRRCLATAPADDKACDKIVDATSAQHVVTDADVGFQLAVRLTVSNAEGAESASARTSVIPAPAAAEPPPSPPPAPPPLPPAPAPTPVRTPSGAFTTAPTFELSGPATPSPAAVAAPSAPGLPARPALIKPFPVITVRGVILANGVRLSLVYVSRTRGARAAISCGGAGCPVRTLTLRDGLRRARAFERFLPSGTELAFRVTMPGRVGKYMRLRIGSRRQPTRVDRCLMPGASRPVRCPSS
jgi:hypothetical protein